MGLMSLRLKNNLSTQFETTGCTKYLLRNQSIEEHIAREITQGAEIEHAIQEADTSDLLLQISQLTCFIVR